MAESTLPPRTYPEGAPSWIDTEQPDPDAAAAFYGALFGWEFEERLPPQVPGSYRIATRRGLDVAAISSSTDGGPARWNTFVAVDDADAAASAVAAAGGSAGAPQDAGPGGSAGRSVACTDRRGTRFLLWQAGERLGAQFFNEPGGWVFSDLRTTAPDAAVAFYAEVFGWVAADMGGGSRMIRLPGYGDHLAATSDPDIRERQVGAPPGFADAIATIVPIDAVGADAGARAGTDDDAGAGAPGNDEWGVSFSVADRDAAVADVERLGGTIGRVFDAYWVKSAEVVDPQGAPLTLTQFAPGG